MNTNTTNRDQTGGGKTLSGQEVGAVEAHCLAWFAAPWWRTEELAAMDDGPAVMVCLRGMGVFGTSNRFTVFSPMHAHFSSHVVELIRC